MTFSSISSAYLSDALLPAVRQTQAQLANLEIESSSGQYSDLGLQLGDQSGYELSLRSQDDFLQAITAANAVTAANMSTAQSVLSTILSSAQSAAQTLTQSATASNTQSLGQSNLQQLIALGNTTGSGGYLFGGQNTEQAPLDDYYSQPTSSAKTALDSAFQSFFGFPVGSAQVADITSTQMQSFLSGPVAAQFQQPQWGENWSTASSQESSTQISPGQVIDTSTNSISPGFQQLAQGYAMLSEFGGIGLSAGAQQALTSAASDAITQGVASITQTQAQLGQWQSDVTQANNQMSAQMTLLQKQIDGMDSVDPAEVATQLTTLSTQLETAYQITSQIHNLNLAQYLPT